MKKKIIVVSMAIFLFMITPCVEAKEIKLDELYNGIDHSGSITSNPAWNFELSPGDTITFDGNAVGNVVDEYLFNSRINVYIDNEKYEANQQFTCQSDRNCHYTVLSYKDITGDDSPRGNAIKISGTISWYTSSLYFPIDIYYQYIGDEPKEVIYHNTDDAINNNPTTYYENETDILLYDPTREGYKFLGWYTSPTFEEDTRVTMITSNEPDVLNLYAKWEKIEETITNPNTSSMFYIAMGIGIILILGTALVIVYKYKKIDKD